jgi:stearoyl-CoA desaturase (delta-9 desaturase)
MRTLLRRIVLWFDSWATAADLKLHPGRRIDWLRVVPFIAMHIACLGVFFVGWSWTAVGVAFGLYVVRMFAVTAFYHRYFSHRTFQTSRVAQFAFAVLGASCGQRGPLWWAGHHRNHHRNSDTEHDVHSPRHHGLWWSHMGWITAPDNFPTDIDAVKDLARYPELRFLDRFDALVPLLLGLVLFLVGGVQLLVWGFFVSTIVLFHCTCTINSLAHTLGRRRYSTSDDSRNSLILALITFGEGWHNNHHRYPGATRQGHRWWEVDLTFYGLWFLSKMGVIWSLHPVPEKLRKAA